MARPEKPDDARRNRSAARRDWVVLPREGRGEPAPPLPSWREWSPATLAWWDELWSAPQAVMWDPSGRTLHHLAMLQDDMVAVAAKSPGSSQLVQIVGQMRQIHARHGLDPRAMADMKWRVAEDGEATEGRVLSMVPSAPDRPDPALVPSKRAKKAVWVDWAVSWGADRKAAQLLSKAKLIEQFSSVSSTGPSPAAPGPRPGSKAADRLRAHSAKPKGKGRG